MYPIYSGYSSSYPIGQAVVEKIALNLDLRQLVRMYASFLMPSSQLVANVAHRFRVPGPRRTAGLNLSQDGYASGTEEPVRVDSAL